MNAINFLWLYLTIVGSTFLWLLRPGSMIYRWDEELQQYFKQNHGKRISGFWTDANGLVLSPWDNGSRILYIVWCSLWTAVLWPLTIFGIIVKPTTLK